MENIFEPTLENIKLFFASHETIKSRLEGEALYALLINLLKGNYSKISWIGYYNADIENSRLVLGSYIGPLPCEYIPFSKGVCGKCYTDKKIQIVEDVNSLPYHIACSSLTKSELVMPIYKNGEIVSVLDIDSTEYSAFDVEYASKIEEILQLIESLINY